MAYVNKIKIEENDPRDIMESVGTRIFRGTCSVAGSAEVKDVILDDSTNFTLENGVKVAVTFINANTNNSPKLNVNGSGSIPIVIYNSNSYTSSDGNTYNTWGDYETVIFTLKGSSIDSAIWINSGSGKGIGTAYDLANSAVTTAGTGLVKNDKTINHSNSISAGTVGTSSATSGPTLDVPYIAYDSQGHITSTGTHTHTISDNKVTQTNTITDANYRVLFSNSDNNVDETESVRKSDFLIYNPYYSALSITYGTKISTITSSLQKVEDKFNPDKNTAQYYNGVVTTDGTDTSSLTPNLIQTNGTIKAGESVEIGSATSNGSVTIRQAQSSWADPYNLKFNSVSSRYMAMHGVQYSRMYDSGTSGTAPAISGSVNNTTRNSNGYYASDNTSFSAATKGSAMTREDGFIAKDGNEVVTHDSNGMSWEHGTGTISSLQMYTLSHHSNSTAETTYTIDIPYGIYLFLHSRYTSPATQSSGMQFVTIGQTVNSSAIIKTLADSGSQIGATSGIRSQVTISDTKQGSTSDSQDKFATVTWTVQGLGYRRLVMVRLM